MREIRTILAAAVMGSMIGATAFGDLLILKDGRRIEGRLGGQDQDKVTFFLKRGNVSTRMEFARDEVEEIREGPIATAAATPAGDAPSISPTAAEQSQLPELSLVMNQYCASHSMATRRVASAGLTSAQAELVNAQRETGGLGTVRDFVGKRVMISGRVADVERDGALYVILLQPIRSTVAASLTEDDMRRISEAQKVVEESRDALDRLNDRGAEKTYRGLDERAWRLRMEAHLKAIAQAKRAAVERKAGHLVQIRTPDAAALSLRPGSGVHFPATVSTFEMVDGRPAAAAGKSAPAGPPQYCIRCDAVAEQVRPATETAPSEDLPDDLAAEKEL